jgi:hypothetical protein
MTVDCDVKFIRDALRTATDDGADPACRRRLRRRHGRWVIAAE